MLTNIKLTWGFATFIERVILVIFPVFAAYDVVRGNWFDLFAAIAVTVWVANSVRERIVGVPELRSATTANLEHPTVDHSNTEQMRRQLEQP